jgi:hypothetical protein
MEAEGAGLVAGPGCSQAGRRRAVMAAARRRRRFLFRKFMKGYIQCKGERA